MQRAPEFRRLECHVLARFQHGLNFVRALGFVDEAPLEAWDMDGNDHIQFKRIARAGEGCHMAAAAE